ncbi:50S ribosomal protein L23 [Mucisphaera sp.]|uniref:50S ribosomal protein L23 n=1 Tax=Mucisphaera sp. TaxID=2913024 RepID=UPI003D121D01
MRDAIHIIKKPLITEKSSWESNERNRYSFEVAREARKPEIKKAIEELYDVKVVRVATQIRKGEIRRTRFGSARRPDWKRATVQLEEGQRIELF